MRLAFLVKEYITADGKNTFREWLAKLDGPVAQRIQARVLRLEIGNLGDAKSVGAGVFEARLDFGPGYRFYFGRVGSIVVLLLCGGDKRSQTKDISRAKKLWKEYLERTDA